MRVIRTWKTDVLKISMSVLYLNEDSFEVHVEQDNNDFSRMYKRKIKKIRHDVIKCIRRK